MRDCIQQHNLETEVNNVLQTHSNCPKLGAILKFLPGQKRCKVGSSNTKAHGQHKAYAKATI